MLVPFPFAADDDDDDEEDEEEEERYNSRSWEMTFRVEEAFVTRRAP